MIVMLLVGDFSLRGRFRHRIVELAESLLFGGIRHEAQGQALVMALECKSPRRSRFVIEGEPRDDQSRSHIGMVIIAKTKRIVELRRAAFQEVKLCAVQFAIRGKSFTALKSRKGIVKLPSETGFEHSLKVACANQAEPNLKPGVCIEMIKVSFCMFITCQCRNNMRN